jgi:hypothetical protein
MQVTQSSVEVVSTDPEIVARVAAVDVGKDAGVVCVRTPDESRPGQRATRVWTVPSRTTAMTALADQLIELGIDRIVLEATSDYWRPFLLSAGGTRLDGMAGQCARGEERAGSAEDGQARCGVASQIE